jgi:uncharacterized repeat protein (TIGR01451 family)
MGAAATVLQYNDLRGSSRIALTGVLVTLLKNPDRVFVLLKGESKMKHLSVFVMIVVLVLCFQSGTARAQSDWPLFVEYQSLGGRADVVAWGDFNSDGRTDAATADAQSLYIFLQDPLTAQLTEPLVTEFPGPWLNISMAVGDFNQDGRADIATRHYCDCPNSTLRVWLQTMDGTLALSQTLATAGGRIAVADVNGDGREDVIVAGYGALGFHLQNSGGGLAPLSYPADYPSGGSVPDVGDVNGDGRTDVVKTGYRQGYCISVYPQTEGGTMGPPVAYDCSHDGNTVAVGDVTGDGREDVVMSYGGNRPETGIFVWAQTADGTLAPPVTYAAYDIPTAVEIEDVDLDGKKDVIVLHQGWLAASVFRQLNDGTLTPYELYELPYSTYSVESLEVADLNSDGFPDLLVGDYFRGLVVLYHSTGDLSLSAAKSPDITLPGQLMSVTLRIENLGPLMTRNVVLSNTLPAGSVLIAATPTQGTCTGSQEITCQLGNLGAGSAADVTIVALAPPVLGIVMNTAEVQAFGDVVLNNNATLVPMRIGLPNYLPLIGR